MCRYVGTLDTYLITHVILSTKNTELLLLLLVHVVFRAGRTKR